MPEYKFAMILVQLILLRGVIAFASIGHRAMVFTIWAVGRCLLTAEMKVGFTRITDRPLAHSLCRAGDRMVGALNGRWAG